MLHTVPECEEGNMEKVAVMWSGHMIPIMGSNKVPVPDLEPSTMVAPAAGISGGSTWGWSANANHQHTNIGVVSIGADTNRMTARQQHGSGIVEVVGAERAEDRVIVRSWRWSPARWSSEPKFCSMEGSRGSNAANSKPADKPRNNSVAVVPRR